VLFRSPVSRQPTARQISRLLRATRPNSTQKAALPGTELVLVPQSRGTGWFNALRMAFFFRDRKRAACKQVFEDAYNVHFQGHVYINSGEAPRAKVHVDLLQRLASLVMMYKQPANSSAHKAFDYGRRPEDILA